MTTGVQTNTLNFIRMNITSINRITKSNEAQAKTLEGYAMEAREDARDMKRVAFLTMFFLPATATAVLSF